MKDPIILHCNFCDNDVEIMEDDLRALVYEGLMHIEFECTKCHKVFADCYPSVHSIILKTPGQDSAKVS